MKTNLERKSLLYNDACQCKKKSPLPLPSPPPRDSSECRETSGYFSSQPVERSSEKRVGNNKENGCKSPDCAFFFLFYSQTSCHRYLPAQEFVEEGSMNKFILKFGFCGFYNHYRICSEKRLFQMPLRMEADLRFNNNTTNYSRNFTVSI